MIILINRQIFCAPQIIMEKFEVSEKVLETTFKLKSAANPELISLIINSGQTVEISYRIKIFEKRGFLRSDRKVIPDTVLYSYINYNRFSRVFTLKFYDKNKKVTVKRFIRSPNNRKTIRMILSKFFYKKRNVKIDISSLNRKEYKHLFHFRVYISSVKLTPPYNIVNSSFNFRIDKDITF